MRIWRGTLDVVPAGASVLLIVGMLWLTRRGLEMLDESYLIRLIAFPQETRPAGDTYLFGFVVHPLWELAGHDIALLRALGTVLLVLAGTWLALEGVALLRDRGVQVDRRKAVVCCLVTGASSLVVLSFNVMVPAYRSVALIGLVAASSGAARALRGQPVRAGALLGFGGGRVLPGSRPQVPLWPCSRWSS